MSMYDHYLTFAMKAAMLLLATVPLAIAAYVIGVAVYLIGGWVTYGIELLWRRIVSARGGEQE